MYTIYYERDGGEQRVPVVFAEKESAMENACELLRLGFRVLRIQAPGFCIGAAALHDYRRATTARVHGQTLLRKRRRESTARAAEIAKRKAPSATTGLTDWARHALAGGEG
jgi:hypothetical protein